MEIVSEDLLRRFVDEHDGQAFAALAKQHADMVYAVCLRILRNDHHAADATQETFLQLLKSAKAVTGSVSGWLHQVATAKAIDLARRESRYRQSKEHVTYEYETCIDEWKTVSLYLDEALESIDSSSRDLLIGYYLESRDMAELARALGVSQPTISRRIRAATEMLRRKLKGRHVVASAAVLAALLQSHAAHAAPALVVRELGKMALAGQAGMGVAGAHVSVTAAKGLVSRWLNVVRIKLVAAILFGGASGYFLIHQLNSGKKMPNESMSSMSQSRRKADMDLSSAQKTVNTLVDLLIQRDWQAAQACFWPGSVAARELQDVLTTKFNPHICQGSYSIADFRLISAVILSLRVSPLCNGHVHWPRRLLSGAVPLW